MGLGSELGANVVFLQLQMAIQANKKKHNKLYTGLIPVLSGPSAGQHGFTLPARLKEHTYSWTQQIIF